jgi:hypothetical protein
MTDDLESPQSSTNTQLFLTAFAVSVVLHILGVLLVTPIAAAVQSQLPFWLLVFLIDILWPLILIIRTERYAGAAGIILAPIILAVGIYLLFFAR